MKEQNHIPKFHKIFGLLYFVFNCVLFAVIFVLAIYTSGKYMQFSPGWIYLTFPGIGMLSGYWIRTQKFKSGRSIVIALSFFMTATFLFIAFVGGPQLENMKKEKFIKFQESQLIENTKQMFVGVYSEDINIIKELLNKGVDVNATNETEETALHVTQSMHIARMLIARGANVHARDDSGMTPIFNKEIEIAEILLDAGADINTRSERGNTPLLFYTYSGYLEGIQFLVLRGAKVKICNVDNQNGLDIAKHFHPHTDVEEYMKSLHIPKCSK